MVKQIADPHAFKRKALQWASSFDVFCCLDSNNFTDPYSRFDVLIAAGVKDELTADAGTAFDELAEFRNKHPGWMPGFLGYDLKNETEKLTSANTENLNFPDLYFFVPRYIVCIKGNEVEITGADGPDMFERIAQVPATPEFSLPNVEIKAAFGKKEYLAAVINIQQHILRGDIYVTNFCQEFYAENADVDPLAVYLKLNEISPNPFSAFFKWKTNYILCASPERFLAKRGGKLISQPIKGTAKRGKNETEDDAIKQELRNQTKEQQENVMIVDLVRNDLTKSAKPGTVKTEELFGIYSFNQVHQMISTVVCELQPGVADVSAIKNAFPMGSMTGAPKISAMQLMEQFEHSKRGVYSGAIGYFAPDGDFDFNVVIRTILYNQKNKYLSFHAGSAITFHADAEKEYEECLLKTQAILQVLGQSLSSSRS
ncbi:anthranilate synthase component I family protein [Mucilaginibacter gotjawali]|uniref:Aminodeoxychorismate synthase component 1 n=2 Tax=Mucilaginibacter gotjawali TaxID=1550579 RepID=A0A120MYK5_9SPHI|nr:anthranilate synthase component I family protein [Mucilaginibacter gotjawali]MBB3055560.1 para-aminobenzoate synthetase component 1 [Mucilaginibacter gotjawali]BAU53160.1 Aminodeoxychorismate synthase component 1 [Mucilaginibacter gotjawali]